MNGFPHGQYRVKGYYVVTPADQPTTVPLDVLVEARNVFTAIGAARRETEIGDVTGTAQDFTIYHAERVGPGPNTWS
jgi:hypothetical protein